jgi:hypothetical protein
LNGIDNNVNIDSAGNTLPGRVLVDIGQGNRDQATSNSIVLADSIGAAKVTKDVAFLGGSGNESYRIFRMEVGGDVSAASIPVTGILEDRLQLFGVTVHGNVNTSRLTYTQLFGGTIDGNVNAKTIDLPCGMGLRVSGTVHGNVTATDGATAPSCGSYAFVGGTVDGDVRLNLTAGYVSVNTFGEIGGSFRISEATTVSTYLSMTAISVARWVGEYLQRVGPEGSVGGSIDVNKQQLRILRDEHRIRLW